MNEHTQLAERLRMANPVPEPAQPPIGAVSADVVLLQIERRSTDVQTTERETHTANAPQRRWTGAWYAAAAFAAVIAIVLGVIALLSLNGNDDEPVATTTTAPTTTTEATTTTLSADEIGARLLAEMEIQGSIGPLEPGSLDLDSLAIPLSIVIPDRSADYDEPAWYVEEPIGLTIMSRVPMDTQGREREGFEGNLHFIDVRADDLYQQVVAEVLAEVPVTERADTIIGGASAVRIDVGNLGSVGGVSGASPLDSLGTIPIPGEDSDAPVYWLSGNEIRDQFYIIDAPAGTLIVIFAIDPDEWDTLAPYWEQILASIEFMP